MITDPALAMIIGWIAGMVTATIVVVTNNLKKDN